MNIVNLPTLRSEMAAACAAEIAAYTRQCGGRVALTPAHLEAAGGNRDNVLAEARIGCCQKCGCLSATAWFEIEGGVEYVVAQRNAGPSTLALGDRVEPPRR